MVGASRLAQRTSSMAPKQKGKKKVTLFDCSAAAATFPAMEFSESGKMFYKQMYNMKKTHGK